MSEIWGQDQVVIHQPYFLPWLGYFSKLAFADAFVVLDDTKFRKRHFQDRTKIIDMHSEVRWIGLPVGENFLRVSRDVIIEDDAFLSALLRTVCCSYAKAQAFKSEMPILERILNSAIVKGRNLVTINVQIILQLLAHLDFPQPQLHYSSSFELQNHEATDRILKICQRVGADSIIIGMGKSLPMHDWTKVHAIGVQVFVQDYLGHHPVYQQVRRRIAPFEAGLSIIDALLNVGRSATRKFLLASSATPVLFNYSNSEIQNGN